MLTLVVDLNVKPEMRDRFYADEAAAVCLRQDGGQTNTTCTLVFPRTELVE